MSRLDDDAQRFYAALAARAEAEDYCPIEQVTMLTSGTGASAEEFDSLVREMPDSAEGGDAR